MSVNLTKFKLKILSELGHYLGDLGVGMNLYKFARIEQVKACGRLTEVKNNGSKINHMKHN